ncbi:unnamed protein product [Discosporangium mesarthrocarpum]
MDHPGLFGDRDMPMTRDLQERAFTVGIGGPVGSGKTALMLQLCRGLRDRLSVGAVTNDIFTREDAEFLTKNSALEQGRQGKTRSVGASIGLQTCPWLARLCYEFQLYRPLLHLQYRLQKPPPSYTANQLWHPNHYIAVYLHLSPPGSMSIKKSPPSLAVTQLWHPNRHLPFFIWLATPRIMAIETGGCPHAAIREDISANLMACENLTAMHAADLILVESGGDNLAANYSRELADFIIYVIDVAGGDKVPRKGGPGITQSDLLVINKTDLAEAVGADLEVSAWCGCTGGA